MIRIFAVENVASFTDAWIETLCPFTPNIGRAQVASFTDAWIETRKEGEVASLNMSHLLQMRGLKLLPLLFPLIMALSHLLQMRGLKHDK